MGTGGENAAMEKKDDSRGKLGKTLAPGKRKMGRGKRTVSRQIKSLYLHKEVTGRVARLVLVGQCADGEIKGITCAGRSLEVGREGRRKGTMKPHNGKERKDSVS